MARPKIIITKEDLQHQYDLLHNTELVANYFGCSTTTIKRRCKELGVDISYLNPKQGKNLVGQYFGDLVVLELTNKRNESGSKIYKCQCSCGNIVEYDTNRLTQGTATNCGCKTDYLQRLHKHEAFTLGDNFGLLTIISEPIIPKNKNGIYYKCKCECGNEVIRSALTLRNGQTTHCGCKTGIYAALQRTEDKEQYHIGQQFGLLTIISKSFDKNNTIYYKCQCQCGNITDISCTSLRRGTKSCGCLNSFGESCIISYLQNHNIEYIKEYTFDDLIGKYNRKLRFDFAIFNNHQLICLIEYDGKQHFGLMHSNWDEDFDELLQRDRLKNEYCIEHNIPLFRIPYTIGTSDKIQNELNNILNKLKEVK